MVALRDQRALAAGGALCQGRVVFSPDCCPRMVAGNAPAGAGNLIDSAGGLERRGRSTATSESALWLAFSLRLVGPLARGVFWQVECPCGVRKVAPRTILPAGAGHE